MNYDNRNKCEIQTFFDEFRFLCLALCGSKRKKKEIFLTMFKYKKQIPYKRK